MADLNEDRLDRVHSLSKAALAIGAGAAFLYRGRGGNDALSKGLKRTSRALNEAYSNASEHSLKNINGRGKAFAKKALSDFSDSYKRNENIKQSVRTDSTNSLFDSLQNAYTIGTTEGRTNLLKKMYNTSEFIPKLKSDISKSAKGVDERKTNQFVDDMLSHINSSLIRQDTEGGEDFYKISVEFAEKYKKTFNEEQIAKFENDINRNYKNKKSNESAYVKQHKDLMDNVLEEQLNIDSLEAKFGTNNKNSENWQKSHFEKLMDNVLGDRRTTLREYAENSGDFEDQEFIRLAESEGKTFLEFAKELIEKDDRYGDLYIDHSLRTGKDGTIRSFDKLAEKEKELEEKFLYTLPGKLIKPLETRVFKNKAPNNVFLGKGTVDYQLPKILENRQSTILEDSYFMINNTGFRVNGNYLEKVTNTGDFVPVSGMYGSHVRIMKNVSGDIDYNERERGYILDKLDLFSTPKRNPFQKTKDRLRKFTDDDWSRNISKVLFSPDSAEIEAREYYRKIMKVDSIFNASTFKPRRSTATKLSNAINDEEVKEIFNILSMNNDDMLKEVRSKNIVKKFFNNDAYQLIEKYKKNPAQARSSITIVNKKSDFGLKIGYNKAETMTDSLRKELTKEALLKYSAKSSKDEMLSLISSMGISKSEKENLKSLSMWATLQELGETSSRIGKKSEDYKRSQESLVNLFLSDSSNKKNSDRSFKKQFQEHVKSMIDDNSSVIFDKASLPDEFAEDIVKASRPSEYIYVKKRVSALDIIEAENKTEKAKAYAKQFVAGRNNMEDFTTASFYPYFSILRLTDAVPEMAFSPKNTKSVGDLAKNIVLRRALPAAVAISALSYIDFESRNLTGVGLKEAAFNSWSNFDLGVRTFIDKTPLANAFKNSYYTNDATNYYRADEYKTADEQVEWLKTGVSPVRQGRFWSMSSTEFRGGKIEYFEPNKLRQATTPWKDIGVYGSSDEKWKHSIIPTLRHPLSPLRYALDPYWLEKKNKFSRPYPVSAPMFGEGAPWSGIGNATIGQLIKPRKIMNREVLGKDFVDVRDIIEKQNLKIRQKENREKYITLTGSDSATEVSDKTTTQGLPGDTGRSDVGSSSYSGTRYQQSDNDGAGSFNMGSQRKEKALKLIDKIKLASLDPGIVMPQIEELNARIRNKAASKGTAETNYAKAYDAMTAPDTVKLLRDKNVKSDLRNVSNTNTMLRDMAYSSKEIGGIYGFIFDEIIPGKKKYRLKNASQMSSFSQGFWDESIGGFGGEVMEIARRFFPHNDRNNIDINPLRNTMPSWMPESFKHGDPYTKVKKGEMRLPGRAYEAINNYNPMVDMSINPNMIGASVDEIIEYYLNKDTMNAYFNEGGRRIDKTEAELARTEKNLIKANKKLNKLIDQGKINSGEMYSDYQRFKILADVAPSSSEYKLYRSKVKDSLTAENKKDYYDTLERVNKQSGSHTFYKYRYKGKEFEEKQVYISEVLNNGFKIVGDDRTYSMAGINASAEELSMKIAAGMKVGIKYDKEDKDSDAIKAIIYSGLSNVNREMANEGTAERRSDGDAIDAHALATGSGIIAGRVAEFIGHAQIPFFHNKFLKVETAHESYKNEQVYGTPFATWSHPIQGYITPAFNKAAAAGSGHALAGTLAFASSIYFNDFAEKGAANSKLLKQGSKIANLMITPGAATGALIGFASTLNSAHIKTGARVGSVIWGAQYLNTHSHNPLFASLAGAGIGSAVGNFLEEGLGKKYSAAGALIGLGVSYAKTGFNIDKMNDKWIPKKTKKRWEIEEYFDRLNYIKYRGLYEKAARVALRKEKVDIKSIIEDFEKSEEKRDRDQQELLSYKQKLNNSYVGDSEYGQALLADIENELVNPISSVTVKAGEYTKSAIAYKQAMDSTIYGLQENASWAQVLRALPKNDRDYFLEFAEVTDEKERKKILETVSPYKQNVLRNMWGIKEKKVESNATYFSSHKLPSMFWRGWRPKNDIENVQIKTIENEGMLLSDFGIYESAKRNPGYDKSDSLNYDKETSILTLRSSLLSSLNGLGLAFADVSIEPSQMPGIQMVADFVRSGDYRIKKKINESIGRTYY